MCLGYLSKISLSTDEVFKNNLVNSYNVHQNLWKAFPEVDERVFLYTYKEAAQHILMFSKTKPKKTKLGRWVVKEVPDVFLDYSMYNFELTANPIVRKMQFDVNGKQLKRSKKFPLTRSSELDTWLRDKGNKNGFSVIDISFSLPVPQPFVKNEHRASHSKVVYSGLLKVTDPDKFKKAFMNGIGTAKAFGFGMLLLRPYK